MKKKLIFIVLSLCLALSLCMLAGCHGDQGSHNKPNRPNQGNEQNVPTKNSEGLEFTLNEDGKSYSVTGIGTCKDVAIVIPKTHQSKPVTGIGESAFENCTDITSISIPNSLTAVGKKAFFGCSSIRAVYITDLTAWCNIDFEDSPGIYSMTILTDYLAIPDTDLYLNGKIVTELTIPNGIKTIKPYSFAGFTITDVKIPSSVTAIGDCAFALSNLKNITIPDNVTSIGEGAFGECFSLINASTGNGVKTIGKCAFGACSSLVNVIIGDNVTTIGDEPFGGCVNLLSITIGKSVTSMKGILSLSQGHLKLIEIINKSALEINGKSFLIHDGEMPSLIINQDGFLFISTDYIDGIRDTVDHYHNTLYDMELSSPYLLLGYIGSESDLVLPKTCNGQSYDFWRFAFAYSRITSIVIPDGVTSINAGAFYGCSILTNITIPDSVTSIRSGAFWGCFGLTSLTIGSGVTSINASAFLGCIGLENIIVNEGNTTYHSENNCLIESESKNLILGCKNSIIPDDDSVTSIDSNAFYNCEGLTSVTIGKNITSIAHDAFYGCVNLDSVYITDIAAWCNIDFYCKPDKYSDEPYSSNPLYYANNLYLNNELVTELVIPDGTTVIKSYSFYNYDALTKVTIPDSVSYIGEYAFSDCDNLQYNEYDDALYLGNEKNPYFALIKFKYDPSNAYTATCEINDNTKIIADKAFYDYYNLTGVTIGKNVTHIGDYAFYNCYNLTNVTISDNVTHIGNYAFSHCDRLTSIIIPDSVTSIGGSAFSYCDRLTSIIIPDSVSSIGEYAFTDCDNLQYNEYDNALYLGNEDNPYVVLITIKDDSISSCTINEQTKMIYYNAFLNSNNLTTIIIPDNVTSIGDSAFRSCDNLASVTIGNGVTSIGDGAFEFCDSLTSIIIPDNVTFIDSDAFYNCDGLTSVTIGKNVTSIGEDAFYVCKSLTKIIFNGTVEEWKAIEKGSDWNECIPATQVNCTDGNVDL